MYRLRMVLLVTVIYCHLLLLAESSTGSKPKFIKIPTDEIGVSGGVASFVCQATGDPKPHVTWNKRGKKVNSQRFETIEFDEGAGAVLRIQPLRTPRDENVYECVAQNVHGEEVVSAKLTVLREDQLPSGFPNIDMGPQLKVVERTRTATMLCAASGNPDPEITWFKDFLPVDPASSNGRIKQLRSETFENTPIRGALQIENSEETDQGKYECVATNSAGVRYSSPANLYVRELREVRRVAPRFSILPVSHEIMPGGNVNITCVAVGSPMPYVKWMVGAEELTPEDDMPVGRNVLELTNVKESANYTCVAMSSLGVIESVAQITVKSLPKAPGTPVVTETTATSITVTWDSGNPDPVSYYVIEYKSKSQDGPYQIKEDITTTRYSIGGLSPNSEYEIWVSAVNSIGQGPPSEPVVTRTGEQAPASAPRNVQARMLRSTTMIIQWEEPVEPNGQIRGYRVYYTMEPDQPVSNWLKYNVDDSLLTTIGSLLEHETYTVRVLAFTSVGDGPLSDPIQVKTQQGVPGQPMNFRAEAKSETSIVLTWSPPRQDSIVKYELSYKETERGNEIRKTFDPATSYTVEGLKPNTEYLFRLSARSSHGLGAWTLDIKERTMQSKPTAPPRNIKCVSTKSTTILVSWLPPPAESQNGVLAGYSVRYSALDSEDTKPKEVKDISPQTTQILLEALEKWTVYHITVLAHTEVGPGPESPPVEIRTDEDVPSAPPRKVEVEVLNSTAIKVFWRSPIQNRHHGQIRGYQVHYVRMENGEASGLTLIKDVMLADAQWDMDDTAEYEMIISGLQPETSYSITVAAYTMKGDGARSKPKIVTTKAAVPGRPDLFVHRTSEGSLLVEWKPPRESEEHVLGYRLQFGRQDAILSTLEFGGLEKKYLATNIHKGATYIFKMAVKGQVGFSEEAVKEFILPEDTPKGFPQLIERANVTSMSIQLNWLPPVLSERNGVISKYTIAYRVAGSSEKPWEMDLPSSDSSFILTDLNPNTVYEVKIRAHTSKGPGPYSPTVQYRTFLLDQVLPKNFKVKMVTKTSVLLGWEFPENYTSLMLYKIQYNIQTVEVDGRTTKKLITNLKPKTYYNFILTNRGNTMGGLQQTVAARTAPNMLGQKPMVTRKPDPDGSITVLLPEVETSEPVRIYYIVVVPLKKSRDHFLNPWGSPEEMDLENLIQSIPKVHHRSLRHLLHLEFPKPYIAAGFHTLPGHFTLGDQKIYDGFENKALEIGQRYVFFILAMLEGAEAKMFAASPYSDPIQLDDPDPQPIIDGEEGLIWVIGPVLAVVFIICIVIAILLYKNKPDSKRKNSDPRTKCLLNNAEIPPHHPTDPVEMRRINFQTPGIIGSDYINANYIDGYRKQNAYIATQGALPETFGDFWRMVWEQRSATVVMMTKLEEKSRVKCDQYWPSRGTETYGMIQVTLLDTIELATFCVRTFSLHKSGSSEKREVRQFQFTAWPDHGVPEYPTPFLAFLRRVKTCNPPDAGPIVVHCSAGVGRTGCFIVIDAMLERIKHEKTVDIYGHVTLMRSQRNYMVQTEDQYSFIHDALLEAVACGNTEVPARNLYTYIQNLAQIDVGEHVIGMELEFKRLANSKAHTSRFISANLPCNKFKNRLVNIMPYETTRVCLQPIRGVEGSDYINASFIDGYRQQKAYIATQGPLAETTEDFWRMLWENNSTIVVMLTKLREMGREKCHQYWPAERSARYQYFVVDPMAEYNMPQYILREFKVTDARDGQSRTVRQFQFTDWPEQGVPKSGEGFIDFIGQVHKTKEQFGQDGPISVHCSAGVGRTGVFITLSIVLERMRYEGVVDIFQTVKMLRTQRPAMVQTEDEYQFCYQAALEYLGSFDHYAT
ncbi:receptor-type tyrosine-protein phosphatase S isoform X8 [Xenopus laevis]|uniref:Receptor-type tyrosine-protein phosphatase S n=1 Tax=Xenopus laevis TaxID=8355 RepID=A0A8J1M3Z3_XENLA|nr:receptor-type tyrosine-protein phosphatase S isoform X8 [Xenopus laevis]